MHLNAIIVDDEFHARENLHTLLYMVDDKIDILSSSEGGADAIEKIKRLKPDLLFLDIEMPVFNGFELLKAFPNPEFSLVVVTAYSKYGMAAVNASAQYFLQKPIETSLLEHALEKVRKQRTLFSKSKKEVLANQMSIQNMVRQASSHEGYASEQTIECDGSKMIIKTKDILYLEASSNYSNFHLIEGKKHMDLGHLAHFEKFLDPNLFIRVHRSFLCNLLHIKDIHSVKLEAELVNGERIAISRRKLSYVKEKLREFKANL